MSKNFAATLPLLVVSMLAVSLLVAGNATTVVAEDATHLFILSGQSNMAGLKPEESFTPTVVEKYGEEHVVVVKDAVGGQPIRRWYKDWKSAKGEQPTGNGDLYDRLMGKVKEATKGKKIDSVTFLWMQGERDAKEQHAEVYAASFKGVIAQLQADLKRKDLNVVIGRLSDFDLKNQKYPHWTKIRKIQVELAESQPRAEWVDTDDLNDGLNRGGKKISNDLHYSGEGYVTFGKRLADKAIGLIEGNSKK